jgi:putative oxidoreductase
MSAETTALLLIAGRLLLGGMFVVGGSRHFFIYPEIIAAMQARGVPAPALALMAGTAFQIVAGACLALGILITPAAFGLVAFTVAASIMMLNFWDMEGAARENARNNFQSNVAIIGGLLIAAA